MRYLTIILLVFGMVGVSAADTITIKDGLIFRGKVLEDKNDCVKLQTSNGDVNIPNKLIKQHDRNKSPYELYQAELDKIKDKEGDAESQYKLGIWCKSRKIWHKAKLHLQKALEIDKEHKNAEKSLKEVEKSWEEERKRCWISFTFKVGVVVDMSKGELEKLASMIKSCSRELARSTGGMMYIKEVIFTDNTRQGNMLYDPNQNEKEVPGSRNNFKHGPTNWFVGCILHEFGHFMLGLADEYNTGIYGHASKTGIFCKNCKMALEHDKGWCNILNHPNGAGNTPGCQELLIGKYKTKCPLLAEAFNYGQDEIFYPPEPVITINDTGPKSK